MSLFDEVPRFQFRRCVLRLEPLLFVCNNSYFSFTDLNIKKRSVSYIGVEETKCGYINCDASIFGGSHASGNIALMGISICKSCKMSLVAWIDIRFILCDFFLCILGIDYLNWTNFGVEIHQILLDDNVIFARYADIRYVWEEYIFIKYPS